MITATISCPYNENIVEMFLAEERAFDNNRASYTIEHKGGELIFVVTATDFVALRAMLNAITKNLSIHGKVGKLVEEENGK